MRKIALLLVVPFVMSFLSGVVALPVGTTQAATFDIIQPDAGLAPLDNNGGPTLTHALLTNSIALDAADAALCPATDQRGVIRPQGSGCDIGSFEAVAP